MISYIVFPPCVYERDGENQGAGWVVVVGGEVRCVEGLLPKKPTKTHYCNWKLKSHLFSPLVLTVMTRGERGAGGLF